MSVPLSIVIPVYNVAQFLPCCLDSVFSIGKDGFEVICVNDGSEDNSISILEKYRFLYGNRITIVTQSNQGLSAARNAGLRLAQGDYVFFLDSDDSLTDATALCDMLDFAYKHNVDMVVFNAMVDSSHRYLEPFPTCQNSVSGPQLMRLFYQKCRSLMIPVWGHLYRRAFLVENNLWFKKGIYHEDVLFTPIAQYLASKAICVDACVVDYRWHRPGAITTTPTKEHFLDRRDIGRELFQWFNDVKAREKEPFETVFSVYDELLSSLVENGTPVFSVLDETDFNIMSHCAYTAFEKRCVKLARKYPKLYFRYRNNGLPLLVRKGINLLIR